MPPWGPVGILKVTDLVGLAAALPPAAALLPAAMAEAGGLGDHRSGGVPEPPRRGAGDTALDVVCDGTADAEADPALEELALLQARCLAARSSLSALDRPENFPMVQADRPMTPLKYMHSC